MEEVQEGRRGSGYRAIRRLGDRPGEIRQQEVTLPAFVEQGLSSQQAADRLADHFSAISQTVDKLDLSQFHPALRSAIEEGRISTSKPVLTQHQVYRKMLRVTKPSSSVPGDVPMSIIILMNTLNQLQLFSMKSSSRQTGPGSGWWSSQLFSENQRRLYPEMKTN